MSDFDKEAEREKLREKFAKDREKRQHTQQMSELLLKGATMTNRHCGRCGDPIFRHDGQEFCPSCGTGDAAEGARGTTPTDGAVDAAADAADVATNNAAATDRMDADVEGAANANAESPVADAADAANAPNAGIGTVRGGSNDRKPAGSGSPHGEASTGHEPDTPGLEAAQRSLTEAITTLSRRAADADDPRRAKEYLEAAREAAEALAALR